MLPQSSWRDLPDNRRYVAARIRSWRFRHWANNRSVLEMSVIERSWGLPG
jgi:hypothetical protein